MSKSPVRWRERHALLARAALQAAGIAAERRGQGRLRDLRLGPQGRDAEPRADRAGDPGPAEDAPPRRQRRRRGGRLRADARPAAKDLGRGGPRRRPRPLAHPRRRLRRRPRLRRALPGPATRSSTTPASCSRQGGFRVLAERIGVVDSPALGPTAREEEPHFWQLAGLVPDAAQPRPRPLRAADRARAAPRRPRPLLLRHHLRLQGDGRAEGARRVLPGPARRALRDDRLLRPQPLLDQHLALVQAGAAVLDRSATTARSTRSSSCARRRRCWRCRSARAPPTPRTSTDDRHDGQPRGPQPGRGDGDGGAADRRGDPRACRRICAPSTCTCTRRWARSPRARWR